MAVYVDKARHPLGRMLMGHMVADSRAELHAMAAAIGMRREWFQGARFPHYDVSLERRAAALKLGAVAVTRKELVAVIRRVRAAEAAAGVREPVALAAGLGPRGHSISTGTKGPQDG